MSDEDGWKNIRNSLIRQTGMNNIPVIYIESIEDDTMILHHEHDKRDIDINYAKKVLDHVKDLWKGNVRLITTLDDEPFEI